MNKLINLEPFSLNLDQYKVLEVSGADALTFLNSQTTNNVKELKIGSFHFDALLDVSGRVDTYFITIKKDNNNFYLLIPSLIYDDSLTRIQKYHIIEDVHFKSVDLKFYMNFFTDQKQFSAQIASFNIEISTEIKSELINNYDEVFTFLGLPLLNKTLKLRELINNTLLNYIAIDFNKGCFIGQETVSKIHTRRGAAMAPMFIKVDAHLELNQKIKSFSNSVGEVLDIILIKGTKYYLCLLNRENRVNNKDFFIDLDDKQVKATVKNMPLISLNEVSEKLYHEAVKDFQSSNENLAITKLKKIISANPRLYDAYESLGVIYGRQENFDKAIEVMHHLEKIAPKSVMAQTNLSMFYMKIGEIEKAEYHKGEATFKQFQVLGDEAESNKRIKEIEENKKQELLKREKMFQEVLKIDEKDPLAAFGLGTIRYEEGRFEEAREYLEHAIESDSKYSVAYLALAKVYKELNEIGLLKDILEKGIKTASRSGDLMPANEMQNLLITIKE